MIAADVASINEQPEVCTTLELMASPTEDPSQGLEVSYTDQILIPNNNLMMQHSTARSHACSSDAVLDPLIEVCHEVYLEIAFIR